jgi:hypothetical protein
MADDIQTLREPNLGVSLIIEAMQHLADAIRDEASLDSLSAENAVALRALNLKISEIIQMEVSRNPNLAKLLVAADGEG